MPGPAAGSVLIGLDARAQTLQVALIANSTKPAAYIAPVTLTIDGAITGNATAQSITIDSVTLPADLRVGQHLTFSDAAGRYLAEVTAVQTAGPSKTTFTAISIEDIPDNATAQFPPEVELLTEMSLGDTTTLNTTSTFDHEGSGAVSRGGAEQSWTWSCLDDYYNAGLQTMVYAKRNDVDLYWADVLPNPDATAFATGAPKEWGVGKMSDATRSGADGDKLSWSLGLSIDGGIEQVRPS